MDPSALHALELSRVLLYLAGFAVSEAGYQACLALRPFPSLEVLHRETLLFEQGRLWAMRTQPQIEPFPILEPLLQNAASSSPLLDLNDLFILRQVLAQGKKKIAAFLEEPATGNPEAWPLWIARCGELRQPVKSMGALTRCLSDDALIRDNASPELALVRGELYRLHQQCARKVKDYTTEYNIVHFLQDSFMTLSSDRYVLPLKANFKGRLQGVIHEYSQTGETCYFEPLFLVELNNRLQNLKWEEREEERKILASLNGLVHEELPSIYDIYAFLTELDMLLAKIALAECYDGRMLEFADGRGILLREAKHPLLALATSKSAARACASHKSRPDKTKPAFPLSLHNENTKKHAASENRTTGSRGVAALSANVTPTTLELLPEQRALVLSGGNAGGKTICLKTAGLLALMGMCALPVPVQAGSVLPCWRRIHAFIGDEQSLEDHVSTFTAQICHLVRIWPELGSEDLVILDEFGAGTDPSQGAALAQAVMDCLVERGAFVVMATHFPALKAYALSASRVRAASVLFDPETKKPLFRLAYDQVGVSRALDVAREYGLPEEVLQRTERYLTFTGEESVALVERLNTLAVAREAELAALAKQKAAFWEKRHHLQERFEQDRTRLFASVREDAQTVLNDWKNTKINHRRALKELSRIRNGLANARTQEDEDKKSTRAIVRIEDLASRQRVRHIPWQCFATVLETDPRKNRVRLNCNGLSLWADIVDIELTEQPGHKVTPDAQFLGTSNALSSSATLPLRLDLRGFRADVAVNELEVFLDRAILSDRTAIEVVHGRGTGTLRREIHTFLKNFPAIREYRLAPEDQGGDGVTIVELS